MNDFDTFLAALPKIINAVLPGEQAHLKMSPPERHELIKNLDLSTVNVRKAAVMMLIYPNSGTTLALIQRNSYKGVHSSQVAFPGGKIEANESALAAALRETHEEIGVTKDVINVIRPFSEVYIPPSNFLVKPFLGVASSRPDFHPDPREVVEIIELPIEDLLNDSNIRMHVMDTSYSRSIEVPSLVVNENVIWGATAMMLSELKEVLKAVM